MILSAGGTELRAYVCLAVLLFLAPGATAQENELSSVLHSSAAFEVVKSHFNIDVNADGSFEEADENVFKVLDSRGQKALQQTTFSYTEGLESVDIASAYTLKPDGEKISVPENQILRGFGATSAPGFQDIKTITVVFPRLDIGDEIVLETLRKQIVPLFAGEFAMRRDFSRSIRTDDAQIALTAPANALPLKIEAVGLEGGQREEYAGKYRWVWRYHNDAPLAYAVDSVLATDDQPHLIASSFPSYEAVGRAYAERFDAKAAVTPEIQSLADRLTNGISGRRAQAKALYDWVASNITYVNIVLGAGGFTPHAAAEVLALRHGDCKDHVMLLEALLAAKGIRSNPALIASNGPFVISQVPSAFYFNHVITWVPEFGLFLDSTPRYAPFGVLPFTDADRPVVLVPDGTVSRTPNNAATQTTGRATAEVRFDSDGTARGRSNISMSGNAALMQRTLIDLVPPDREKDLFQMALGPGSEATIDRGNLQSVADPFTYSLQYTVPNAANFAGPGAIPVSLVIGTFSGANSVLGIMPSSRQVPYACPSIDAAENTTFEFPSNVTVTSVPNAVSVKTDGVDFNMRYQVKGAHTVVGNTSLRLDHPHAWCTPDYYTRVRGDLMRIAASLRAQILYK